MTDKHSTTSQREEVKTNPLTDRWKCDACGEIFQQDRGKRSTICPNPNCMRKGQLRALSGIWSYFDVKGRFVPKLLADAITKDHHFATHRASHVIWGYRDGAYSQDGEEFIRTKVRELLGQLATASRVHEVVEHIRETNYRSPEDFEPPKNLINVKNGVLNANTRKLTSHTHKIIFTNKLPIEFNPNARCPKIGKFLREVLPKGDIPTFIQAVGFCLYREYFIRKVIILLGPGGNGKSTVLKLVITFLGRENVSYIAPQELSDKFAVAGLYGKLANIYADLPSKAWKDTSKFKMTTGRDMIEADVKHKSRFKFENFGKFFYSANMLPETDDTSQAFYDRLLTVKCEVVFVDNYNPKNAKPNERRKDKDMLKKIATPEELSGLLNAALAGLEQLVKTGAFITPQTAEEVQDIYIRKSSPIAAFVMDCLDRKAECHALKDDVYNAFVAYCQARGYAAVAKNVFGGKLQKFIETKDTQVSTPEGRKHAWLGIALVDPPRTPAQNKPNRDAQDAQRKFFILFKKLNNYGILANSEFYPVQPVRPSKRPTSPKIKAKEPRGKFPPGSPKSCVEPTVSDLKARLWDAFGVNPFKRSQIPKHFSDDELVRLTNVMDKMRKKGELTIVRLESGAEAWQLVRRTSR